MKFIHNNQEYIVLAVMVTGLFVGAVTLATAVRGGQPCKYSLSGLRIQVVSAASRLVK